MHINEGRLSTAIISVSLRLGYTELKPYQESAVKSFGSGKNVFVSLPTGYGKSFYYSCLSWVFDILNGKQCPYSIVVVVRSFPIISIHR